MGLHDTQHHVERIAHQLVQIGRHADDGADRAERLQAALVGLHLGVQLGVIDRAGGQVAEGLEHLEIVAVQRRAVAHIQQLQHADHLLADPQRQQHSRHIARERLESAGGYRWLRMRLTRLASSW